MKNNKALGGNKKLKIIKYVFRGSLSPIFIETDLPIYIYIERERERDGSIEPGAS